MQARTSDWRALLPSVRFEVVAPTAHAPEADGAALAAAALESADARAFLAAAARRAAPLTVVVNDPHRFTDTRAFLAAFLPLLDASGASTLALRALIATGSHRSTPSERAEHEAHAFGPFAGRFREVAWHDARDDATLGTVGATTLHRWMTEGGHFVACGSMEPHYFAGVTGAHKTLTVGVMSLATLTANHRHAMSEDVAGLKLAGNPIHEGIVAALGDLEASGARLLALNQVIVDGRIVACTAGHPLTALEAGLPVVRRCFSHRLAAAADVVVARVGPPLDRDLYQADKGIKNTEIAVRDGGVLILEAGCERGVGLDAFVELLRAAPSHADALAVVGQRGYRLGDHKAVRLRALTDRRGVHLAVVSAGLDPALAGVLGATLFREPAATARWARDLLAAEARGCVVEDAGNLTLETA